MASVSLETVILSPSFFAVASRRSVPSLPVSVFVSEAVSDALVATVSAGATYQVYEDFTCKTPVANNLVTSQKDGAYRDVFVAYVKVTSEDGSSSSIHKVTIQSQASNTERPTITGTVSALTYNANATGEKEYTIYLPAGKNSITRKKVLPLNS